MIRKINFVSIPVEDQDRALEFYTTKLGFRLFTDQPFNATQRWLELRIPGAETMVVLFKTDNGIQPGAFMNMSFGADDVAATAKELMDAGVHFTQPPTQEPWGMYAMFKVSEGNQIVLSTKA
ncbi:MAG: VOC family protein [Candidatus Solibacter usitatus]|nr:VOC family protein [Candidatus Solibacter usitatus]